MELLEQRQPAIIYVQSEDMVNELLTRVVSEKAAVIERHDEQTSETEEMEILKKLENGQLIAVVSNTTLATLAQAHCVEHFVSCHLTPGLDEFFKRCQPAFTSAKNTYLHLIYNNTQDIGHLDEWLSQKYPNRETLGKFYTELKKLAEVNSDFINPADIYDTFDMTKLGIETGLTIFEELQLLERSNDGINLLPSSGKKLDESKIHCRGQELKHGLAEVQSFQLERPIEKIWEEILRKIGMDGEQI